MTKRLISLTKEQMLIMMALSEKELYGASEVVRRLNLAAPTLGINGVGVSARLRAMATKGYVICVDNAVIDSKHRKRAGYKRAQGLTFVMEGSEGEAAAQEMAVKQAEQEAIEAAAVREAARQRNEQVKARVAAANERIDKASPKAPSSLSYASRYASGAKPHSNGQAPPVSPEIAPSRVASADAKQAAMDKFKAKQEPSDSYIAELRNVADKLLLRQRKQEQLLLDYMAGTAELVDEMQALLNSDPRLAKPMDAIDKARREVNDDLLRESTNAQQFLAAFNTTLASLRT